MSNQFRKLAVDEIAKIAESQGFKLQPIVANDETEDDCMIPPTVTCDCLSQIASRVECKAFGKESWDFDSCVSLRYTLAIVLVLFIIIVLRQ